MTELAVERQAAPPEPRGVRLYWRRLRHRPVALVATIIFSIFLLLAVIGPWVSPYSATHQDYGARIEGPSLSHPFGTDQYGRDVFSRVLAGTRGVFVLCGLGAGMAVAIGTITGLFSGYVGGFADEVIMRIYDVLLSIPSLLLAMVLIATVGPSKRNLVLVVGILYTPDVARVVRSVVLDLKTKEFVEAAKVRRETRRHILFREILPNALGPLMVESAMRFSYSIFTVASLGFLGLGVQPPSPDWGLLINEARGFVSLAPWMIFFPAAAIALLIISTSLMSDGLKEIGEPVRSGD
jgi:peptide/nickel transport system permease protein